MKEKKRSSVHDNSSKFRRTAKTWTKQSSERNSYSKKRQWQHDEEETVPFHAVSMNPRLKKIQHKEYLSHEGLLRGWVVNSTGRSWIVEHIVEHSAQWRDDANMHNSNTFSVFDCVVSRSVISENPTSTLIAVGDIVLFKTEVDFTKETDRDNDAVGIIPNGVIVKVEERRTKLAREAAGRDGIEQVIVSNIDQVIILLSAADPFYNKRLIDRYLIAAEQGNVEPILCINKIDLMDEDFVREDLAFYEEYLDSPVLFLSAATGKNIEELREVIYHKTTVFSGPSGVGKSTVVNMLLGETLQAVSEVSEKTSKGLHTTTFSAVFPLAEGGYILDTPGIREFGIWNIAPEELPFYFHDFDAFRLDCRFTPCTHTHEPHCAVKQAVEEGLIDAERYESYCNILGTLEE